MRNYAWFPVGAAAMFVSAAMAQNLIVDPTRPSAPAMTTRIETVCQTHNTLQKLQRAIDAAKKEHDGPDKAAKKEHLRKDIDRYQQELREMKATLEEK